MTEVPSYTPPKVWVWNKESGGRFAKINDPEGNPIQLWEPGGKDPN